MLVDSIGKFVSTKVIAHKLTAVCGLEELLMGETEEERADVSSSDRDPEALRRVEHRARRTTRGREG